MASGSATEDAAAAVFARRLLEPTREERVADWHVLQAAIVICMGRAGFTYRPVPPQGLDRPVEDITSPGTRRAFGYGVRWDYQQSVAASDDRSQDYLDGLSHPQRLAYQAQLVECSIEATRLMGLPPHVGHGLDPELLYRRLGEISETFWGRAETIELVDQYCRLMREKGLEVTRYSAPDELLPHDLGRLLADASYRNSIFEREARVAMIDASCMDGVYQPLRDLWLAHARDGLADILSSINHIGDH